MRQGVAGITSDEMPCFTSSAWLCLSQPSERLVQRHHTVLLMFRVVNFHGSTNLGTYSAERVSKGLGTEVWGM
jgi:hypothetical protein